MFPNVVSNIFSRNEDTQDPFSLRLSTDGGKRHMDTRELSVKDHHIFYCEGQLQGKLICMGKLMSNRLLSGSSEICLS